MTTVRNRLAIGAAIFALVVPSAVLLGAAPASAIGGNCESKLEKRTSTTPDTFRALARCSSLNNDTKARAKLIRDGGPDYTSAWFTTLNRWYATGWYTCYAGCTDTVELSHL